MRRRGFISLLGGAAAWPLAARAQQSASLRRISVLMPYADDPTAEARLTLFRQTLETRGWIDGRNVRIDYYFANSDLNRMRTYATQVVATAPDVVFAASPPVLAALKQETNTIPVVFTNVSDPVGVGLVQSLSHPGGNVTGFAQFEYEIAGKWVELLKEIAP
jgi:putative tryptophan/tyrosine transport system substrate-binding protein